MSHSKELIEIDLELTRVKDFAIAFINIFHMLRKVGERISITKRHGRQREKNQYRSPGIEIMSDGKYGWE